MQRRSSDFLSSLSVLVLGIALCALSTPRTATAQNSGAKVGVAAAVRGAVSAQTPGAAKRSLRGGDAVYLGDTITTGAQSNLQILLLDETVFTVGFQSNVVIDEFVYDPASHDGKVDLRVNQGTFRFTTGQVARKKPEQLKVHLPVATIGVRGTGAIGQASSQSASVMLAERGDQNDLGLPPSAIVFSNGLGATEISDANFGSEVPDPNSPPTPPTLWDDQKINGLLDTLQGDSTSNLGQLTGPSGKIDDSHTSPNSPLLPVSDPFGPDNDLDRIRETASQDELDEHAYYYSNW